MKDYAPPWEADVSNQPRKREMMHQKGSDMDECAIVDMYDLGCVKEAVKESTPVTYWPCQLVQLGYSGFILHNSTTWYIKFAKLRAI